MAGKPKWQTEIENWAIGHDTVADGLGSLFATVRDIVGDAETEAEEKAGERYEDGFAEGKAAAQENPDVSWLSDLEAGLHLIDTDREVAKVYLDRCTKEAGRYLIEVAPCLL